MGQRLHCEKVRSKNRNEPENQIDERNVGSRSPDENRNRISQASTKRGPTAELALAGSRQHVAVIVAPITSASLVIQKFVQYFVDLNVFETDVLPTQHAFSYALDLRPGFLAHMANRLDRLICQQTKRLMTQSGVETPVRSMSVLVYLSKNGPGTVADIAQSDGQSHQLVTSRTGPLEELGLIEAYADPEDDRRRLLALTAKGKKDAKRALKVSERIAVSFEAMNVELGVDLMSKIESAEQYLSRTPLGSADSKSNA